MANKYNAKKVTVDGITFDSKREAARWQELKLLERAGRICQLTRQVKYPLEGKNGPIMTESGKQQRVYVADFKYLDWDLGGIWVVEDSKGFRTKDYLLKKSILAAQGVTITET